MSPLPLPERPIPNTVCLFDVDGTLTPARRDATQEIIDLLLELKKKVVVGFVGGSDLPKQEEQLAAPAVKASIPARPADADADAPSVTGLFDYAFSENGLVAYRLGKQLASESFIHALGEDRYNEIIKFVFREFAELDLPVRRGTFVELRRGMVNISPIGRSASHQERLDFFEYDKKAGIRQKLVEKLRANFGHYGLTFAIGGQISFDVFPNGWDKTYCLRHLPKGTIVHFFGDRTEVGGNDHEIYTDPRVIGHSVKDPQDTIAQLKELFFKD